MKPSKEEKIIFWINAFNFLNYFTLILKKEIPHHEYEYKNIIKNSFYNIGNYVFSLESIEEILIKGKYDKHKLKESFLDNEGMFLNTKTFPSCIAATLKCK